jgi:hypothetical protein
MRQGYTRCVGYWLKEHAKQWTKMQELSFIYMKQNFVFIQLGSSCIYLPFGPRSVEVGIIYFFYFFLPCKRLVDNEYLRDDDRTFLFVYLLFTSMLKEKQIQKIQLVWIPKCLLSFYFIIIYFFKRGSFIWKDFLFCCSPFFLENLKQDWDKIAYT